LAEYKSRHTGAEIDAGIDKASAALPRSGGTMTGELILSGDPLSEKAAATRQYVDRAIQNLDLSGGESGVTFIPSVTEEGVLTWTNDGGLPNPPQISVRGAKGDDGFSPTVAVSEIEGGHCLTVTDKNGVQSFNVLDGAGGADGVSWNDLKDKPFGVETRSTILNETIVILSDQGEAVYANPLDGVPADGAKYIVKWANTNWECVGRDMSAALGIPTIALGNVGAMTGGEDSGEPFAIALFPEGNGENYAQIVCLNPDHYGAHIVLKIESVEVSKIPGEFLPPMASVMFVNVTGESVSEFVADKAFADVYLAAMTGETMVFLRWKPAESLVAHIPLLFLLSNSMQFAGADTTSSNFVIQWNGEDGTFQQL